MGPIVNTTKFEIRPNSCILSVKLLDELDHIIGGYGKPTIESLLNLNVFAEAYIFSSHIHISHQDLAHMAITTNVLFPNGRPMFLLLGKDPGFAMNSLLTFSTMTVQYVKHNVHDLKSVSPQIILDFQKDNSSLIQNSLELSSFSKHLKIMKGFYYDMLDDTFFIGSTNDKPREFVNRFYNSISNNVANVQVALPISTYKTQLLELKKKTISKDIISTLCDIQGQHVSDIDKYFGCELQVIPPLVSIVLSKAKNREDIPKVLTELRKDFTDFRVCCEKFEKRLIEASTIKEQVEAVEEYRIFWATLVKKYNKNSSRIIYRFLDIAKNSNYEETMDNAIDQGTLKDILKDLNLGKVAGKTSLLAWDKLKERKILNRFRGVVNLWKLLEDSPAIDMQIKNIERIFHLKVDRNRLLTAKKYVQNIKSKEIMPSAGLSVL